jgi:hypothetical protein
MRWEVESAPLKPLLILKIKAGGTSKPAHHHSLLWVGRKRFSDPHCSDDLIFRRIEPEPELHARLSHGSPRDHLPNHGQMASVGFGAMCSWGNSVCLGFGDFIAGIVPAELGSEVVDEQIGAESSGGESGVQAASSKTIRSHRSSSGRPIRQIECGGLHEFRTVKSLSRSR